MVNRECWQRRCNLNVRILTHVYQFFYRLEQVSDDCDFFHLLVASSFEIFDVSTGESNSPELTFSACGCQNQ